MATIKREEILVAKDPVRQRRSHTERRAESSARIIEATIRCLSATGYGATSIDAVIAQAGVSKGRLLNLFPTKVDLMIAVSQHVWYQDQQYVRGRSEQLASPQEMLLASADMLWLVMSAPAGVAVMEILVASRSDIALAERFVPAHRQVQERAIEATRILLADVGLAARVDARAMHDYMEATIRGLVIDRVFSDDPAPVPIALQFVRDQLARICALSADDPSKYPEK